MNTIDSLRKEIDQVHKELHTLLVRRRDLTFEIWKIKQAQGLPFHNAAREGRILADFVKLGSGVDSTSEKDPQFEALLNGVMTSVLREYEKYLKSQYP